MIWNKKSRTYESAENERLQHCKLSDRLSKFSRSVWSQN